MQPPARSCNECCKDLGRGTCHILPPWHFLHLALTTHGSSYLHGNPCHHGTMARPKHGTSYSMTPSYHHGTSCHHGTMAPPAHGTSHVLPCYVGGPAVKCGIVCSSPQNALTSLPSISPLVMTRRWVAVWQ
eukprot:242021-Chlamydomonas_euryale.AAC.2